MTAWSRLGQSFWFLPAVLCTLAVVLAEGLIVLERRRADLGVGLLGVLITRVGPSGSRDLLGAVAGSMLTVASTTFSITVAVLALSSSTYGPRLVRNFMADRGNQLVLGVFVATFLYSLVVLRSIRVPEEAGGTGFVPHLAVNVAVGLAILAIGVLVYFIHHISDLVQVWTLATRVRTDLLGTIDRLCPEPLDGHSARAPAEDATEEAVDPRVGAVAVAARALGHVQAIDLNRLVALAARHDVRIHLDVRPGSHTNDASTVATIAPALRVTAEVVDGTRKAITVGPGRTPDQDVEFPVLILEEMAVRALSPGTNDPYTALNALDELAAGLVRLAGRKPPAAHRRDADGVLRVVAPGVGLGELTGRVIDAMRRYALGHPDVLHRTLELSEQVGTASADPEVRAQLDARVSRLLAAICSSSLEEGDAEGLARHGERVHLALRARDGEGGHGPRQGATSPRRIA